MLLLDLTSTSDVEILLKVSNAPFLFIAASHQNIDDGHFGIHSKFFFFNFNLTKPPV